MTTYLHECGAWLSSVSHGCLAVHGSSGHIASEEFVAVDVDDHGIVHDRSHSEALDARQLAQAEGGAEVPRQPVLRRQVEEERKKSRGK